MGKLILDKINSPDDLKEMTYEEMDILSKELRDFIINSISNTGGHLASNLGVVELTIALHYVFNSPKDKIVWDVGHQTYVHKILTGRKNDFNSLRQFNGLSGFPKRCESEHDCFETGHSSTSISAALGMARARDIYGDKSQNIAAIIGDGALTGGMAFEALNDAGHSNTNLIVILNDNEMSISKNVGALSKHLSKIRISSKYNRFKNRFENITLKIPFIGKGIIKATHAMKRGFKSLIVQGMLFEEMGFKYLGPIDGHDIKGLIEVLEHASSIKGPIIVHTVTQKGKGYKFAEKNPEDYHGVSSFVIETGKVIKKSDETFSEAFGNKLAELAEKDDKVVAITAAMTESTGLLNFMDKFPNRLFDVGIAEQHAVTLASGIASFDLKPYFAVYSTFLQRAYDQIIHDVCNQNLPVRLMIDRAGLVGEDGETHQGIFDINFLNQIPNMTILAPKDIEELKKMLEFSLDFNYPLAIRYPRGYSKNLYKSINKNPTVFDPLKWEYIIEGYDCCIISFGRMLETAFEAAEIVKKSGLNCSLINARTIKPLDYDMLDKIASKYRKCFVLEDNLVDGGLASIISSYVMKKEYDLVIKSMGILNEFVPQGNIEKLHSLLKLDKKSVAIEIERFYKGNIKENYGKIVSR